MSSPLARDRWLAELATAAKEGTFAKASLGGPRGANTSLEGVLVRPVQLREGPRWSFVYRHTTRDVTRNFTIEEALALLADLVGSQFRHATLFTTARTLHFEQREGRPERLTESAAVGTAAPSASHDRPKARAFDPAGTPWMKALGLVTAEGRIVRGMEPKSRQIQKFVEVLDHLFAGAGLRPSAASQEIRIADMGCGKGWLTFAAHAWVQRQGWTASTRGIETRAELVALCNRAVAAAGLAGLRFEQGAIADVATGPVDVLIALHACDTATDDALAGGIAAGATLLVVSPCCHKEVRPQLEPPAVLAGALRHGILLERHAEFVTDALRAALLDWAGYDVKVFEFISTEHTGKNLMIAATKRRGGAPRETVAQEVRELARFHGIRAQRLAQRLGFELAPPS